MKNTRRKIAFVVLSIFLFLIGCGEDNKKHQAQVLAFEQELMKAVKQADETATEFSVIADNIKNQKISKEEAVNRLKNLKKDMSRITDKMYATKVDDTLPSDIKEKLNDIKDRTAYAYFQKAKVAGHLATYLESKDQQELRFIDQNFKNFKEEMEPIKKGLKEVKQAVGIK
ncbi:hypothetical protein P4S93_09745 [Aneurinibacillus thermoaerophilus]|uniref:Lipoprotein n=1 Tax=Aneurinibacillus thermoaerophilus TaxID=143495 RepID=A0A1G8ENS6_ANETH|nr:hypothetical protein [Aneurinibacillus thermoaerophilus]MED0758671.1 hypothetical protein [Aneurinibacillus thermoaerophilus]MED0761061.1 hypothetical protein [Aneurinibacillus thermoaerophilus]SDH71527.1 hypothetical protein SAMN04489735_104623 [Aneurinibacillus thermoaerophilus]